MPRHTPQQVFINLTNLKGWRASRAAKDLDNASLDLAIEFLEEYWRLLKSNEKAPDSEVRGAVA